MNLDGMTLSPFIIFFFSLNLSIWMLIRVEHLAMKLQLGRKRKGKIEREGKREREREKLSEEETGVWKRHWECKKEERKEDKIVVEKW